MINSIMPSEEYSSRVLGINPMQTFYNGFNAKVTASSATSNDDFIEIGHER